MSRVTSIVLLCSSHDTVAIQNINEWLDEYGKGPLKEVGCHAGGRKFLSGNLYAMGFNHLNDSLFEDCFRAQKWQKPKNTILLIKDETDFLWRRIDFLRNGGN